MTKDIYGIKFERKWLINASPKLLFFSLEIQFESNSNRKKQISADDIRINISKVVATAKKRKCIIWLDQ